MICFKRKKVGLALGSGGAKGLAHIGVIKALRHAGVPIDMVAGSSIGAVVGAFYSATEDIERVEHLALSTNWAELRPLLDVRFGNGLLKGDRFESFLDEQLGIHDFSELRIPFAAVATDLGSGKAHTFRTGSIAHAVRASASVPLVFRPVEIEGRVYGDAGLSLPVPVRTVRALGADVVIAVDLDAHAVAMEKDITSVFDIAQRTIELLSVHLAGENVRDADVVIVPPVTHVKWDAFLTTKKTMAVIEVGEKVTNDVLPDIRHVHLNMLQRLFSSYRNFKRIPIRAD